jgi:hypothetical protein
VLADINWNPDVIAALGIFSVPIIAIIAGCWAKVECVKSRNDLKRSMVERGMSPEDIERVISAKPPKH